MSLRRALLVVAALAAATFFLLAIWLPLSDSDGGPSAHDNASTTAFSTAPNVAATSSMDEAAMSAEDRRRLTVEAMRDLLQSARQQPGNLMQTLKALRDRCGDAEDCQRLIEEALDALNDPDFASLVSNAMARLPLYESAMQATVMSMETPPRERYAAIHALRQELLGSAETDALFGQEAAWAEYQFRTGELLSDPSLSSLSADQRLAVLEQLRNESLGEYREALAAIEGSHGRYERELAVLTEGLQDATEIARITQQLRVTHFGVDAASQMAERDEVVREQHSVLASYRDAVDALDANMAPLKSQMDEASWQQLYEQRLTEIRLQYFP
jgi:hypothetical protein